MTNYDIALLITLIALLVVAYYLQKQISNLYELMQQQSKVNESLHDWNKQLTDTMEKAVEHSLQVESLVNKHVPELFKMISETNDDLLAVYNKCNEYNKCKPKGEL